ncbi:MAG: ligase-associated DNA damage response exonuclease [Bdellovibrionota bacterium]
MLAKLHKGLFCPEGNFFVDPMGAVENAVVTHAHSDHARRGSKHYYCAASGVELLRARLGPSIRVSGVEFGKIFMLGRVCLSFHPAGHILGSAQVRMECDGKVWVASGDYKREPDPTCEPFEVVPCDVFVTEATFGTPAYRWNKGANIGQEIFDWWQENKKAGANSVVFAYSLGKGQRVLGMLAPLTKEKIYCDHSMRALTECYRAQGIELAETAYLSEVEAPLEGALILAPQSLLKSERASLLGKNFKTAFASGWMAEGSYGYDKGFLLSDHADWDDLLQTVRDSQAKRVYVQHRGKGALVRHLNSIGVEAFPDSDLVLPATLTEQLALPW